MKVYIMLPFVDGEYDDKRRKSFAKLTYDYMTQFGERAFLCYNISEIIVRLSHYNKRDSSRGIYTVISPETFGVY